MKKSLTGWMLISLLAALPLSAQAHFGMVIPSDSMVMAEDARTVRLSLSFSHPFERIGCLRNR